MNRGLTGYYLTQLSFAEEVKAFVPHPLPPEPPLEISAGLGKLLDQASTALGRLDAVSTILPDPQLFLYTYIRKEAVLSSQIEGTQSSLSDLLSHELNQAPATLVEDAKEVSCYVAAMEHGLSRLAEGFPLSIRLLKEIHEILLSHGRGSGKNPGEFKRSQNWIGGTRPGNAHFVPCPPELTLEAMGALEKFLHDDPQPTRPLLKAALAHVQFETIHPFLDGNGRLGRLLITFLLCHERVLTQPILYLSLHFKNHQQLYYELLQQVRLQGNWEEWLEFFLDGIIQTATQAFETTRNLLALFEQDRARIRDQSASVLRVHELLQRQPLLSVAMAAKKAQLTKPTAANALKKLENLGIVEEITGKDYARQYAYRGYLSLLAD